MLDDNTPQQPDTSQQPAAAPAPAPVEAAPALTGSALMESIISEQAKQAEPQPPEQPAQPAEPPKEQQQPEEPEGIATPYDYNATENEIVELIGSDPERAYELGAAFLTTMPKDLLEANTDFILDRLGLGREAQQQAMQERAAIERQAGQNFNVEQYKIFDEYIAKGKAAGLSDLEAAGLATMAFREIELGAFDTWYAELRGGHRLGPGRDRYRRAFDAAFKKVAEANKGHKPRPAEALPERPAPRYLGRPGDAVDLMGHILDGLNGGQKW
jgi:hypothetical protein